MLALAVVLEKIVGADVGVAVAPPASVGAEVGVVVGEVAAAVGEDVGALVGAGVVTSVTGVLACTPLIDAATCATKFTFTPFATCATLTPEFSGTMTFDTTSTSTSVVGV